MIQEKKIKRKQLYITSKISPYEMTNDGAVRTAIDNILARLGLEYLDLLLIHWPGVARTDPASPTNAQKRRETWNIMEEYNRRGTGVVKNIGVSNYEIRHLQELLEYCTIKPVVNQVECHPLYPQTELKAFCANHGIGVAAYSPFACGAFFTDPHVRIKLENVCANQAEEDKKTPAQLLLCWALQKGCCCVLPKSTHPARIAEYSPRCEAMKIQHGRWLSIQAEQDLDSFMYDDDNEKLLTKYCWNPSVIR